MHYTEKKIMSDEILDEINSLERRIDALERTFISCTNDILMMIKIQTDILAQIGETVALASSPSDADLKRFQTLREAFDRYDFIRKLTLGKNKGEE